MSFRKILGVYGQNLSGISSCALYEMGDPGYFFSLQSKKFRNDLSSCLMRLT